MKITAESLSEQIEEVVSEHLATVFDFGHGHSVTHYDSPEKTYADCRNQHHIEMSVLVDMTPRRHEWRAPLELGGYGIRLTYNLGTCRRCGMNHSTPILVDVLPPENELEHFETLSKWCPQIIADPSLALIAADWFQDRESGRPEYAKAARWLRILGGWGNRSPRGRMSASVRAKWLLTVGVGILFWPVSRRLRHAAACIRASDYHQQSNELKLANDTSAEKMWLVGTDQLELLWKDDYI